MILQRAIFLGTEPMSAWRAVVISGLVIVLLSIILGFLVLGRAGEPAHRVLLVALMVVGPFTALSAIWDLPRQI